jgi:hypothetical protein
VAVKAETPGEPQDMFLPKPVRQYIHKFAGINIPAEHLPVTGEVPPAENRSRDYRMACFGEGCPPRNC